MLRALFAAIALLTIGSAAARAEAPAITDLSPAFVDFWDRTQDLDPEARLAAFKTEVAPLYPGFYAPREGRTQERWDAQAKKEIADFLKIRAGYVAAQKELPAAFAGAIVHFRRFFPKSNARPSVYLLHSLGEMDGGTRQIDGRQVLIFGADGIARYHQPGELGPFCDHELFHLEHEPHFSCEQVWCALWVEGLATAAAGVMNPGITQRALMLELPRPIAPTTDARWREALCLVRAKAQSTSQDDYRFMFYANGGDARLPPRWGYYVGYRVAQRVLRRHSLAELAHMPPAKAKPIVERELDAMTSAAGGCA